MSDLIERQAVMDGLEKYHNTDMNIDGLTYAYDLVCKLPSVSVAEKTGHWEKLSVGYGCSECSLCTNILGTIDFKYCPKCGAKMGVEE